VFQEKHPIQKSLYPSGGDGGRRRLQVQLDEKLIQGKIGVSPAAYDPKGECCFLINKFLLYPIRGKKGRKTNSKSSISRRMNLLPPAFDSIEEENSIRKGEMPGV